MAARKLSPLQQAVLAALAELLPAPGSAPMDGQFPPPGPVHARDVARITGQSSDGAAYTLRSLVRRELVTIGSHDGDAAGYLLTEAGQAETAAEAARQAAEREQFLARVAGGAR